MPSRLIFWLVLALAPISGSAQGSPRYGTGANGQPVQSLAPAGTRAVVLFFVASDCPVSNRTFPEMRRLAHAYAPRGVRFWFAYPNATESRTQVLEHQKEFDPEDAQLALAEVSPGLLRLTHAFVTPEASVLVPDAAGGWRPVYTGRVDDRFVRLGQERPAPSRLLVDEALSALLAGRAVPQDGGAPVGCTIIGPARKAGNGGAR